MSRQAHETKYKPGKYIFIAQIHQFVKFNNFTVQQKRNDHSLLGPSWLCPCFGCQQIPVVHLLLAGRLMWQHYPATHTNQKRILWVCCHRKRCCSQHISNCAVFSHISTHQPNVPARTTNIPKHQIQQPKSYASVQMVLNKQINVWKKKKIKMKEGIALN